MKWIQSWKDGWPCHDEIKQTFHVKPILMFHVKRKLKDDV